MGVGDVVRAAGISRESFYGQFDSLTHCYDQARAEASVRLEGLASQAARSQPRGVARLSRRMGAKLESLSSDPGVARCLFVEVPVASEWSPEALRLRRAGAIDELCAVFDIEDRNRCNEYLALAEQLTRETVAANRTAELPGLLGVFMPMAERLLR